MVPHTKDSRIRWEPFDWLYLNHPHSRVVCRKFSHTARQAHEVSLVSNMLDVGQRRHNLLTVRGGLITCDSVA